jgi:hypothetical protein
MIPGMTRVWMITQLNANSFIKMLIFVSELCNKSKESVYSPVWSDE